MKTKKNKMQLPTSPTVVKKTDTTQKINPSASDEFTEQGSKIVKKEVTKTKDIRLVMPVPMIEAVDEARKPKAPNYTKTTRTAWILAAIAEKLERESS